MREYSFEDLKKFFSSHIELLDAILNKVEEFLIIIIAAGCTYKVIQLIYASNLAHRVYITAMQNLNSIQGAYTTALQNFL
jgi:hypothetical protein